MIYEESLVHWRLRGIAGTLEITRYCRCIGDYEVLQVHWRSLENLVSKCFLEHWCYCCSNILTLGEEHSELSNMISLTY